MRLDQILDTLSQTERDRVIQALEINLSATADALSKAGHPITEASIRRWKAKREHTA